MKLHRRVGVTSEVWQIFAQDYSVLTGAGISTLSPTNTSVLCYYKRNTGAAAVQVTLADMTLGAYTSGGLKAVPNMPGLYDFCPPDAALATGASSVAFLLYPATTTVTMAPVPIEVQLTQADFDDAADLGLSNLDAAVSTRLPTASYVAPDNTSTAAIKVKTDQMTFTSSDIHATLSGAPVTVGSYETTTVAPLRPTVPGRTVNIDAAGNVESVNSVDNIVNAVTVDTLETGALVSISRLLPLVRVEVGKSPPNTPNTIDLPNNIAANDDAFNGGTLVVRDVSNTPKGIYRIKAYNTTLQRITIDGTWLAGTPADDDILEIYPLPLLLNEAVENGNSMAQITRGCASALLGKSSGHVSGASAPKYRDLADSKDRISAVTDASGNRSAVTLDLD